VADRAGLASAIRGDQGQSLRTNRAARSGGRAGLAALDRTSPLALSEFADDDWIVPSTDGSLTQACRDAGFEPRVVMITRDPLTTRGLIARGIGVGWVPSF
jgi:DNA-binding transcriptional LysR family regulator